MYNSTEMIGNAIYSVSRFNLQRSPAEENQHAAFSRRGHKMWLLFFSIRALLTLNEKYNKLYQEQSNIYVNYKLMISQH